MAKRSKPQSPWVATYSRRIGALQQAFTDAYADIEADSNGTEYFRNNHAKKVRHLGLALLEDLVGMDHPMWVDFEADTRTYSVHSFDNAKGVADALETIINDEWLTKSTSRIADALFFELLDLAEHDIEEHVESARVVLAMGSLEMHLRRLARKSGIETDSTDKSGYTRPRAAEALNADLKKHGVYGNSEQKQITAYLDIRKHAAHGDHDKVAAGSATRIIEWVRMFIKAVPA